MSVRNKRSLVIGRSTYAGSGAHQGHWTGDNHANWGDLALSIPGIIFLYIQVFYLLIVAYNKNGQPYVLKGKTLDSSILHV